MALLDKKTSGDLLRAARLHPRHHVATGLLVVLIGNLNFASHTEYKAVFTNATGVVKGDDVRIAGVKVGTVKDVEIVERTRALVTFTVADGHADQRRHVRRPSATATSSASATSRSRQEVGDTARITEGATIPIDRTKPALDLTVLFNGFKPLFQALSPADINKLSYEIVQVFQGEGGTLEGLLAAHGVGHRHARRPRRGHRRPDRQPQRGARPHRRPRRAALAADRLLPPARRRPQGRPPGHPRLARRHLAALGRRPPACSRASARRSSRTSSTCATSPATSTRTRPSSTAPSRCCRSSSRRSAAPRPTARGSTSTSASSRAGSSCRPESTCPSQYQHRIGQV